MAEPMSGGPAAPKPDNKRALWALILGIVGLVCCPIAAPFALFMGRNEVKAIDAGLGARENRGMALAGFILGIIGTISLVVLLLWVLFFGGVAVLGGLSQGMQGGGY